MSTLLLGVDGGGSRTRALIADAAGRVLGAGAAGSSNYQAVGFAAATAALAAAIDEARQRAGLAPDAPIEAACLGLAGMSRPPDQARMIEWCEQRRLARHIRVVIDAELLLAAANPDLWGIALICGTGSICYGRHHDGHTTRSGGWGYLLGDEGSGYAIATHALRLATQTADGRADAPELLALVLRQWGLAEPSQLIGHVYQGGVTRADIASLAQPIAALADAGDPGARVVIDQAAADLARMVTVVAERLALHRPPIALAGGVFRSSRRLWPGVRSRVPLELGDVAQVDDPAHGALVIAGQLA
jgi:N-acetylglucosamine kinase-like BadF-type ATPase